LGVESGRGMIAVINSENLFVLSDFDEVDCIIPFETRLGDASDIMDLHQEFFEKLAGEWDQQQPLDRLAHLNLLIDKIMPKIGTCKKILNIGSGTGVLTAILAQHYPGSEITSIDIAFAMLQKIAFRIHRQTLRKQMFTPSHFSTKHLMQSSATTVFRIF